ncbi:LVIVD repeat-containing protein [Bizionia arctica]|uniref:LVIVD repeat-containing protein n=1 Tax=Bizionia arctica TaxID=1495645 RepID=A0A917GES7_9FLAO|nr:hypothetical protein [Bizionia arctica]GGG42732.1 hypothetical protein GCM10010976_12760 [Bizionia arctica]
MKKYLILILIAILFSCDSDSTDSFSASPSSAETGQGGSLARFTILNDYLYTVDQQFMTVFNISNPEQPVQVNTVHIGFDIETLFNYKEYLYIGSRNGMFIYNISNPESPEYLSEVNHFTACDPVVANDNFAFVTLHSDTGCGNNVNRLEIYDISDILNPVLISDRNLMKPIGLGLYNNYLFVCDDEVKIFDISDPENSQLVHSINRNAFDVIIQNNLLILIGENGLYQYSLDMNNIENINELSQLNI